MTRIGSLFSGSGMLDVAVHRAVGGRPVWFAESDPAASRVLAHHWPNVANHGDITAVDWAAVEPVDVLTGGFPCQDVSMAGKRLGLRPGTRSALWSYMAYAISQLRPRLVVIENVRGLLSADAHCDLEPCPWCLGDNNRRPMRALGVLLGDLANAGYDTQWCGLRASDVGAPHERFRVFICAWPIADPGRLRHGQGRTSRPAETPGGRACGDTSGRSHESPADATGDGRDEGWSEPVGQLRGSDAPLGGNSVVADPDRNGLPWVTQRDLRPVEPGQQAPPGTNPARRVLDWGIYEPAIRRWESILQRPVPAPTMTGRRGGQQLSPAFAEWMMGWPPGWVTDVPQLSRNDQLEICGNGPVPQQAVAAFRLLLTNTTGRAA